MGGGGLITEFRRGLAMWLLKMAYRVRPTEDDSDEIFLRGIVMTAAKTAAQARADSAR